MTMASVGFCAGRAGDLRPLRVFRTHELRELRLVRCARRSALIREIGDRDPTTRRLLMEILADTEQHASELADYLKRQADTRT